ncbi:GNAT family N-acetyltransferase [Litchfieldella rifensis]|uniref:GNAT family N-acetyltransferase n=1 Tax=Litchfieldella rifensis TaxID=762643 RepID=A0ABV7LVB3_9GAMM
MIREDIKNMIVNEQQSQQTDFFSITDINAYIDKIMSAADVVAHYKNGSLIGFVAFYCNDETMKQAFVSMIVVSPEMRSTGVSCSLLETVVFMAKRNEMKKVCLEVKKSNHRAFRFYEKKGFKVKSQDEVSYIMELLI